MEKQPLAPFALIIFGATGDLTNRKLMPALYQLFEHQVVDERSQIVGFARRPFTNQAFRNKMKKSVAHLDIFEENLWKKFSAILSYQQGRFEEKEAYKKLASVLEKFDLRHRACCNKLFYLATPPKHYETILDNLKETGLSRGCGENGGWTRLLIEKPFGKDLESAQKLDSKLAKLFDEKQIYRIDHYLGKEAVQNIVTFRFANGIFEPVWNREYIDHVQITMAETHGVSGRGAFYDDIGALRDVMQNHMLVMLSLVAMEQPKTFTAQGVRDARCQAVDALVCIKNDEVQRYVVRGQYDSGVVGGEEVSSYKDEVEVDSRSSCETFVYIKLYIDNERWKGVPWYLRTGKRMPKNAVEISVVFKQTCHILFKEFGCPEEGNVLTLRIGPEEGIGIRFITKEPGHAFSLERADLNFTYKERFAKQEVVDAYEALLEDALIGDQMLFSRSDELSSSWQFITGILKAWKGKKPDFPNYKAGSWGPEEARELIEKDGRKWILQ